MAEVFYRWSSPIFALIAELRNQNGGKWKDPTLPPRPGPGPEHMYHHVEVMLEKGFQWALPESVMQTYLKEHAPAPQLLKIPSSMARDLMQVKREGVLVGPTWVALSAIWKNIEVTSRG